MQYNFQEFPRIYFIGRIASIHANLGIGLFGDVTKMRNGEWRMANGEWGMGNEEWGMGNGEWGLGNEE